MKPLSPDTFTAQTRSRLLQSIPRMRQRECQGFLWNADHKWTNQPSESSRDTPSKGNGFELYVDAPIPLIKAPVRIQPPQVTAIVADWLFRSIRFVGIFDLRNVRTLVSASRPRLVKSCVFHVVFRIQQHGYDFVLTQPQKNLEFITIALQQLGALHIRGVVLLLVIIILQERQRFLKRSSLDESQAAPVVDHAARYAYGLAILNRLELFGDQLSCAHPAVGGVALVSGQAVNPQERSRQLGGHALFRELDIVIKGCNRSRFQLRGVHHSRQPQHQRYQQKVTPHTIP